MLNYSLLVDLSSTLGANAIRRDQTYTPKVAIIAPHYGWDAETEEHAKGLLHQDYAGEHEIFFVTHQKADSGYDVSYPHLCEIAEPNPNVHVLLAPNIVDNDLGRSQKVQNLMTAIEKLPGDIEVIAFVDADVVIQENWLTLLVTPLQEPDIGTTVGGRFYFPQTWNIASLAESIWVNFQMSFQGDHPLTMVWGGSNAFRREMLEKAQILERWEQATIEDLNTTLAMRDAKHKVHFVPDCVAITHTANRTWHQIFEFTNRQVIMTFHMGLWVQWLTTLLVCLPKGICVFGSLPFLFHKRELLPVIFIPFLEALSYRFFFKKSTALASRHAKGTADNKCILLCDFSRDIPRGSQCRICRIPTQNYVGWGPIRDFVGDKVQGFRRGKAKKEK